MNNATESYPAIQLQKGRERSIQHRHPWVYSGALKIPIKGIPDGAVVAIQDHQGKHLGLGHVCTQGSIVCRIFDFDQKIPTLDSHYWQQRFHQAFQLRNMLSLPNPQTNGFRLLYAESDQTPGLICDIFAQTAVVQANTHGALTLVSDLADFVMQQLSVQYIYLQSPLQEPRWIRKGTQEVQFLEHGIAIKAHVETGQKTGYFFDQRCNRHLLQTYAHNRTVLDAFCYSGGFSLHALRGGAKRVVSLDGSEQALSLCRDNVAFNAFQNSHETILEDCFTYFRQMPSNTFDCIVLDPPAFAKKQTHIPKAARGYKDLNRLAIQNICAGGLLWTFSCSEHISQDLFRKIVFSAASDTNRQVQILHQLHQAPDHPIGIFHPQSDYLKGLVLKVQ